MSPTVPLLLLLAAAGPAATVPVAPVSLPARSALAIARELGFRESFLATYGTRSDVEPPATTEEKARLEQIADLMGSDLRAAAAEIKAAITPEGSAKFDFLLGNIYFQVGDLDRAAARFHHAIKKFPNYLSAHRNLGIIHSARGRHELAVESLTRTITLGGSDAAVYAALGQSHLAQGDCSSAESAYRSALTLEPQSFEFRLGLTRAQYDGRKFEDVVATVDELLKKLPDKAELWLLQANAFVELKQFGRAAQNIEIIERMGRGTAESMILLGNIYVNENQPDLAARAFGRALEIDAAKALNPAIKAVEILAGRRELDAAKSMVEAVRKTGSGKVPPGELRRLQKANARMALVEGFSREALQTLEAVVAEDPLDGEALLLLGQQYAKSNEPERAMLLFERAGGIASIEPEAKLRHAQVLVGMQRYGEALGLLKRVAELKPNDGLAKYLDQVERAAKAQQ